MARRRKKFNNPFANDNPITDAGNTAHDVGSGKGGGGGGNGYSAAAAGGGSVASGVGAATGTSTAYNTAASGVSSVSSAVATGKAPPAPTPIFYNPTDSHTTVDLKPLVSSISDPAVRSLAPAAIRAGLKYEVNPSILLGAAKVTDYGRSGQGKGYTNLGDGSEDGAKSIRQAARYLAEVGFHDNPKGALKQLAAKTGGNAAEIRKTAAGYTELDNAVRKVQAVPGETKAKGVGKLPHKEARAVAQGVATAGIVGSRTADGYESDRARAVAEGFNLREDGRMDKATTRAARAAGAGLTTGGRAATDRTANVVGRAAKQSADLIAGSAAQRAAIGRAGAPPSRSLASAARADTPVARRVAKRLERKVAKSTGTVPDYVPAEYRNLIADASRKTGVPAGLLSALLQQESGFDPDIGSPAGAQGIAQFMPETAAGRGVDPYDPKSAIPGAAELLAENKAQFGSWDLALAAYNAGGGAVSEYGGIPPYAETQNYVKTVMANAGNTEATAKSLPKQLVQTGYDVLGKRATKALLEGGKLVKAPKGKQQQKHELVVGEMFYDPGVNLKDGAETTAIGGHTDHVHFGSDDPASLLIVAKKAHDLGLLPEGTGENPAFDTIDAQHATGSYHYNEMPIPRDLRGLERKAGASGKVIGGALDISGDPAAMAELNQWIAQHSGEGVATPSPIRIKGTNLAVQPPAPVSTASTSSTGALTGATSGGATALAGGIAAASKAKGQPVPSVAGGLIPRSSAGSYARSALTGATTAEGASPLDRFRSDQGSTGDPILDAFRPKRRRS